MKFHEYITQRRAFGRTPWLRALLIWGLSGGLIVAGVWILVERDWWGLAPLLVGVAVRCIMGFGTKKNWKEDKALEEKGPGSPHYDGVCEKCNPPCYEDGAPLVSLIHYIAATRHITREAAEDFILSLGAVDGPKIVAEHDKYLSHPKFRK